MQDINQLYIDDNSLPVYPVCKAMANYLQEQDFVKRLFNNSIYTYPRWDMTSENLPAICIYAESINSDGMGFLLNATIRVELIRNPKTMNRAAIMGFQTPIAERIAYSFVFNNDFKLNYLMNTTHWVALMDSFELSYNERNHSTVIKINVEINMQEYIRMAGGMGYNMTGLNHTSYVVREVNIDGVPEEL